MIIEGVVTTLNADGSTNVAPMGPRVDGNELVLRPFSSSRTYANLRERSEGVFHITDDVLLIAKAAIGNVTPKLVSAEGVATPRLEECCRWQSFRIAQADWSERATLSTQTIARGRVRDFFGFNRAKHAVLEATILATRTHMLEESDIASQLAVLRPLIDKTAGSQEAEAFALIEDAINQAYQSNTC